jgi:hypothetical protein
LMATIVSSYTHTVHLEWAHSSGFSNAVKASTAGTRMTLSPSLERALYTTALPRCQERLETAYRTQGRKGHGRLQWFRGISCSKLCSFTLKLHALSSWRFADRNLLPASFQLRWSPLAIRFAYHAAYARKKTQHQYARTASNMSNLVMHVVPHNSIGCFH